MMLRTIEAAVYIGLQKSTLEAWRVRGGGPVFLNSHRHAHAHARAIKPKPQQASRSDNEAVPSKS